MANSQNQLMLLSDCLEKIRQNANDTKINTQIQDKEYLQLANSMAEISRNANTCAGVFFDLYMASRPKDFSKSYDDAELSPVTEIKNSDELLKPENPDGKV